MVDRIGYTCILCYALILEIDLAVCINSYVLKESISPDSIVDIGLRFLIETDYLSIAATLEVEYSVVVPTVLVITDKSSLRICRESSLTCSGKTEEYSSVLTIHVAVSGAVHRSYALEGEVVVHH